MLKCIKYFMFCNNKDEAIVPDKPVVTGHITKQLQQQHNLTNCPDLSNVYVTLQHYCGAERDLLVKAFTFVFPQGNDDIYICGLNSAGQPTVQHAFSTGTTTPQIISLVPKFF